MRNRTTRLMFSLSLMCMISLASTSSSENTRAKRSLLLDNVLHHKYRWQKQPKGTEKRSGFDTLDLDLLLNDPAFLDIDADENPNTFDFNDLDFNSIPDYTDLPPLEKEKDEMSNVIPGAQGPFDFQHITNDHVTEKPFDPNNIPAYPVNDRPHQLAESLMDDFMQFLSLKENGMLDQCLEMWKRK